VIPRKHPVLLVLGECVIYFYSRYQKISPAINKFNNNMDKDTLSKIFNLKKEHLNKKGKIVPGFKNTKFEQFNSWFDIQVFNKGCYYCGITNEQSFHIYQLQRKGLRPDATRGGKRGKRLEIDRKDPFEIYDNLSNIVWCCYWCNNAKSNFFTELEFTPVAKEIGFALSRIYNNSVQL
jgi:hypothetical protein